MMRGGCARGELQHRESAEMTDVIRRELQFSIPPISTSYYVSTDHLQRYTAVHFTESICLQYGEVGRRFLHGSKRLPSHWVCTNGPLSLIHLPKCPASFEKLNPTTMRRMHDCEH